MSGQDASALIEALWATFGPVVEERIATVEAGLAALGGGAAPADPDVRDAHAAAHSLAGALGSYGRLEAGATARELMIALESPDPPARPLHALVARLKEEIR